MNSQQQKSASQKPSVVIPLDGSLTAARAYGAAEAVARLLGGTLHVIHVNKKPVPREALPRLLNLDTVSTGRIKIHQVSGEVVSAILDLAVGVDASMIVMSSHGKTHNRELLGGSVAMRVIQHTDIPVMVIRPRKQGLPGSGWRPARMLFLHDGSAVTTGEVDQVLSLAQTMGVDIDVLHIAVAGVKPPAEVGAFAGPRYLDRPHYDWSGWADEFLRRFAARRPEARVKLDYQAGEVVDTALDYVRDNHEDLIALIWHGRLGGKRAATVKGILKRTDVPVLLKRTK